MTLLLLPYDACINQNFFFNDTATTEIYTLSLHDALPISVVAVSFLSAGFSAFNKIIRRFRHPGFPAFHSCTHVCVSYRDEKFREALAFYPSESKRDKIFSRIIDVAEEDLSSF